MNTHPTLTLRIGITGHRRSRLPQDRNGILAREITGVLKAIQNSLLDVHREHKYIFSTEAPRPRMVSALADGADLIAARAARDLGYDLQCPLPFPCDEYVKDFDDETSRAEFHALRDEASAVFELPGTRDEAGHAYEAAGLLTLRQSDILLAVWDGDTGRGRGGTADIVTRAVDNNIPVIWFEPGNEAPRLLLAEPNTDIDARDLSQEGKPLDTDGIADLVNRMTAPPTNDTDVGKEARKRLLRFLKEKEHRFNFSFVYPLLAFFFGGRRPRWADLYCPPYVASTQEEWAPYLKGLKQDNLKPPPQIETDLMARVSMSDKLAVYFAQIYRGSYILNFGLAAMAVAFALLGLVFMKDWKQLWVLIELGLIATILVNTSIGNRVGWHFRWLDYRQLAEQLRHLRVLALTGSRMSAARVPQPGEERRPGPIWVNWYYRATLREISLPNVEADANYQASVCKIANETEVSEQAAYHKKNGKLLRRIDHGLDTIGLRFFILTMLVGVAYLAFWSSDHWDFGLEVLHAHKDTIGYWATFLGGVLPAFGAASFAIRIQGDFRAMSERSTSAAEQLEAASIKLEQGPQSFSQLSSLIEHSSNIMMSELSDWRFVFRDKPLALPA